MVSRALSVVFQMGACFNATGNTREVRVERQDAQRIRLIIPVVKLFMQQSQLDEFFELQSTVRGSSSAQELGLAPVVAQKIIRSIGGSLWIEARGESAGAICIEFPAVEVDAE